MEDPLPILSGVVAFITSTVAEALNCKQGEGDKCAATLARCERRINAEKQTFKEYQHRLVASQSTAQSLLYPFPGTRRSAGPRLVVDHTACRYASLQRPRCPSRKSNECYYYVDLDHLYDNAETIFDTIQEVWTHAVGEVERLRKDSTIIVAEPELLLIVLSPTVSASENPGSMLPFFVHHPDSFECEKNETKILRFGGFPPRVTFKLSPHEWKLFGESLTTQPKVQTFVAVTGSSVLCLTSDFVTHSLYFMEWCVPTDFAWTQQRTLSEGWGCDMLGRLLRTICVTPTVSTEKKIYRRPLKHRRTEDKLLEKDTEAFVDIAPASFGYIAAEETRKRLDLAFVRDTTASALSEPRKQLALSAVLGQLNLMWDTYSSYTFLSECTALAEDPSPVVRLIGPAAQRLLQIWDYRAFLKPSVENFMNTCTHTTTTAANNAQLFLENIRERGWKLRRPSSFSFSHGGQELLETSCVAEGLTSEPGNDAVELADVAELIDMLRSSGRIAAETVQRKLPPGPLATAVREALDSFITKHSYATLPAPGELSELGSVNISETSGIPQREVFNSLDTRWYEHVAFILLHAKNLGPSESAADSDIVHEAEAVQAGRIVEGLEGQLFFIDAALSAIDVTMADRWAHASTLLK